MDYALLFTRDVEVDADLRLFEITQNGKTVVLRFEDVAKLAASIRRKEG